MEEINEKRGALVCQPLADKMERYFTLGMEKILRVFKKRQITEGTQDAILRDMWQRLTYTDDQLTATRQEMEEIREKIKPRDLNEQDNTLYFLIRADYDKVLKILELADQLRETSCKVEDQTVELDWDQAGALESIRKTAGALYEQMTFKAQQYIDQIIKPGSIEIREEEKENAIRHYLGFLVTAINLAEATDEELLQVEVRGELEIPQETKTAMLVEMRNQLKRHGRSRRGKESHNDLITEQEGKPSRITIQQDPQEPKTASKTIKLWQNIVEACSGPLMLATEAKANANKDGEEIVRNQEKIHPSGVYGLKTAIARAQEQIDMEARKIGREPIKLSEERVYQCLQGLQVLANEIGQPRAGKAGVDYFEYETSLRKIAGIAYGTEAPNAELIRQTYEALRVLSTNYVAIEEKRVKNVRIEGEDGKKITRPVVKIYRHFIQMVIMPQITLRTNPDGTINNDIGEAAATIWIHSVLRTGRRTTAPVITRGSKEYIQLPQIQYITYDSYQHSLRFFKSKDGSGRRFFSMILAKGHKNEEDMLQEVFDYGGKIEKAIEAATKRVKKRQEKSNAEDNGAGLIRNIARLTAEGITEEDEIRKEVAAAEKKTKRSITNHKGRDRETLQLWFNQAVELNVIEPGPTRKESRTKPGEYVWEWTRAKAPKLKE